MLKTFCWLCGRFNYQLRDVNQLITRFRLIVRSVPRNHHLYPQHLCAMLFLRDHNPELYQAYSQEIGRTNEVLEFLLGHDVGERDFPDVFRYVAGVLLGAVDDTREEAALLKYWADKRDSFEPKHDMWRKLDNILQISNREDAWDLRHSMEATYKRIELMQKITV